MHLQYASTIDKLIYTQVWTRFNLIFAIEILGRYKVIQEWTIKKLLRKLLGILITYRHTGLLEVIDFSDLDFVDYIGT